MRNFKFKTLLFGIFFWSLIFVFPNLILAQHCDPQCGPSFQCVYTGPNTTGCVYTGANTNLNENGAVVTDISGEISDSSNNIFKDNLGDYITPAIKLLMIIGALICFFMIGAGALTWITSAGDDGKIKEASKKITSAIIGLAILASAWVVWLIVLNFVGIGENDILQINSSYGTGTGVSGGSGGGNCVGALQSCESLACCVGFVCQGVTGNRVCQARQDGACADTCGGTGGYRGHRCNASTCGRQGTSGQECLDNGQTFNTMAAARIYAGSCGQADEIWSSGNCTGQLCGDFYINCNGCN